MKTESLAQQAGMTTAEWKQATRFDSTDWGWIIMSLSLIHI